MSKYTEREKAWRKEYNQRPEVKARQKEHLKVYVSKPEIKEKLRNYQREYMREYWKKNPEQYKQHKMRISQLNHLKNEARKVLANKNEA